MRVGFIGLGIMGKPMARNILAGGFPDLYVWNRSPGPAEELAEAGAVCASKAQIGREAIEQVDSQVRAIGRRNGVSARTALVYEGELSPVVGADGYFDAVIPFRRLLGM